MDRDEMKYVDGGARYNGSQGWVAVSVFCFILIEIIKNIVARTE